MNPAQPGLGPERGLQAERTELAWVRTALACTTLAGVLAGLAPDTATATAAVSGGVVVAAMGAAAATLRIRALRRQPTPGLPPRLGVGLLAAAVAGTGLLAGGLVVA